MASPLDRMREVLGIGVEDIPGATVGGDIPIPEPLINRFIVQALARSQAPVSAVRIELLDGDRFLAHATIRGLRLIPEVTVAAEVEHQPDMPQSPVLSLRWSLPHLGPIAKIAAPFVSGLKGLPPGVRIDGERATVNVAELLASRGLSDILPLLARVELRTRSGAAVVRFELRT